MLTPERIKKIESFVYARPRSIDEIAKFIGKNWRTADRYVEEIAREYGTLAVHVFRAGSRGALKIVFWKSFESAGKSVFQEQLEHDILVGKTKEDFLAFDIFQYVSDAHKSATIQSVPREESTNSHDFAEKLRATQKQLLLFSGNLSFINLKYEGREIFNELELLVKRKVSIKILCRVDVASLHNVERMLALNFKYGTELVEIRHRTQPLRASISDGKLIRLKEVKEPTGRIRELNKKTFIFYTIKDKDWAEWLSRVFWKMFSVSIDANRRVEELKKLK
ncbi:MAG: hypothetical protein WC916_05900 [Candidatus Woesearchaeota archaeon]